MRVKTVERSASGPIVSRISHYSSSLVTGIPICTSLAFLANTGGIVSTKIFLHKWAPAYREPLAITVGIEALALGLIIALKMWMYFDNKKRNKAQGVNRQSKDVPTEALADGLKNSLFRHFYKFSFQVHSNNVVEYSF